MRIPFKPYMERYEVALPVWNLIIFNINMLYDIAYGEDNLRIAHTCI